MAFHVRLKAYGDSFEYFKELGNKQEIWTTPNLANGRDFVSPQAATQVLAQLKKQGRVGEVCNGWGETVGEPISPPAPAIRNPDPWTPIKFATSEPPPAPPVPPPPKYAVVIWSNGAWRYASVPMSFDDAEELACSYRRNRRNPENIEVAQISEGAQ
jgi:hypothetical protein